MALDGVLVGGGGVQESKTVDHPPTCHAQLVLELQLVLRDCVTEPVQVTGWPAAWQVSVCDPVGAGEEQVGGVTAAHDVEYGPFQVPALQVNWALPE
jgi:hypothetical protein